MIKKCKCGGHHFCTLGKPYTQEAENFIVKTRQCLHCGTEYKATYELVKQEELKANATTAQSGKDALNAK